MQLLNIRKTPRYLIQPILLRSIQLIIRNPNEIKVRLIQIRVNRFQRVMRAQLRKPDLIKNNQNFLLLEVLPQILLLNIFLILLLRNRAFKHLLDVLRSRLLMPLVSFHNHAGVLLQQRVLRPLAFELLRD